MEKRVYTVILTEPLNPIPIEFIETNPVLLYCKGLCLLYINPVSSRYFFISAYNLFKRDSDWEYVLSCWSYIVTAYVYEWHDFSRLDCWIEEYGSFPLEQIEMTGQTRIRVCSSIFMALMFRQPNHPKMQYFDRCCMNILYSQQKSYEMLYIGSYYALHNLWKGETSKAGIILQLLQPLYENYPEAPFYKLTYLRIKGLYYFYICEPAEMIETLNVALKLSSETGIRVYDLVFYGQMIYAHLLLEDIKSAESFMYKLSVPSPYCQCFEQTYINHYSSLVALAKKQYSVAIEFASVAKEFGEKTGCVAIYIIMLFVYANVLVKTGGSIEEVLKEIKKAGEQIDGILSEYLCLILASIEALKQGDEGRFKRRFNSAVQLVKGRGKKFLSFFMDDNRSICEKALEMGIEVEYVEELAKGYGFKALMPEKNKQARIHTLGEFRILVNGEPAKGSKALNSKPMSVLKAVLSLGAHNVSVDNIIDAVWPESEGDAGRISLRTNIHRLRQILGGNGNLVIHENNVVSIDTAKCWIDISEFDAIIKKVRAVDSSELELVKRFYGKLLTLYSGEFLQRETEGYVFYKREKVKEAFVGVSKYVGLCCERHEEYPYAVECYKRVIEIDMFHEEAYKRLMYCHKVLDMPMSIDTTYNKLKSVYSEYLGISVPESLLAFRNSLLNK